MRWKRVLTIVSVATWLALAACSGTDSEAHGRTDGQQLFAQQACTTCHGDHGQGSMLGPPLTGAHAAWTREKLVEYLADPQGFAAKDPRLSQQGKKYFQPMPSYKALTPEERASLADYVLSVR